MNKLVGIGLIGAGAFGLIQLDRGFLLKFGSSAASTRGDEQMN
jgi:hypothetical protein